MPRKKKAAGKGRKGHAGRARKIARAVRRGRAVVGRRRPRPVPRRPAISVPAAG